MSLLRLFSGACNWLIVRLLSYLNLLLSGRKQSVSSKAITAFRLSVMLVNNKCKRG